MRRVMLPLTPAKRRVVIYDQLNPAYAKYYTRDEAHDVLARHGFVDVRLHHRHGYSWTVVGTQAVMLVSIVAPVYNEAATLAEFIGPSRRRGRRLERGYRFEFIFVDDGSTDGALELAKTLIATEPRLRVVELRRNFGQTAALQAGLTAARGDIVISMDSDLQHFPEDLPLFLSKIEEGYDLVCGWRHDRREGDPAALAVPRREPADPPHLRAARFTTSARPTAPIAAIWCSSSSCSANSTGSCRCWPRWSAPGSPK